MSNVHTVNDSCLNHKALAQAVCLAQAPLSVSALPRPLYFVKRAVAVFLFLGAKRD